MTGRIFDNRFYRSYGVTVCDNKEGGIRAIGGNTGSFEIKGDIPDCMCCDVDVNTDGTVSVVSSRKWPETEFLQAFIRGEVDIETAKQKIYFGKYELEQPEFELPYMKAIVESHLRRVGV